MQALGKTHWSAETRIHGSDCSLNYELSSMIFGSVPGVRLQGMVAMMAKEYQKPVLVCCETYKFCERVQLDSICFNELGDPDELVGHAGSAGSSSSTVLGGSIHTGGVPVSTAAIGAQGLGSEAHDLALKDWRDTPELRLLNLAYDVTPAENVSLIVTEIGLVPPTSVPVIIREFRDDDPAAFTAAPMDEREAKSEGSSDQDGSDGGHSDGELSE